MPEPVLAASQTRPACAGAPTERPPDPDDYWLGFLLARLHPLAEAVGVVLDREERRHRDTGTITLRNPLTGEFLGRWEFVTGGGCRGSAPRGEYVLGEFITEGRVGPRWLVRQVGWADGEAWDPMLKDKRWDLELHRDLSGATYGCFGVKGDWQKFVSAMNQLRAALGRVTFSVR